MSWLCPSNAVVLVCSFFFLQRLHLLPVCPVRLTLLLFIDFYLYLRLRSLCDTVTGHIFSVCLCSLVTFCPDQGQRRELLIGERIQTCSNQPTPKCSFSSDFGHLILKMFENAKFKYVTIKGEIFQFLGGRPPPVCLRGTHPPRFRRPCR